MYATSEHNGFSTNSTLTKYVYINFQNSLCTVRKMMRSGLPYRLSLTQPGFLSLDETPLFGQYICRSIRITPVLISTAAKLSPDCFRMPKSINSYSTKKLKTLIVNIRKLTKSREKAETKEQQKKNKDGYGLRVTNSQQEENKDNQ